MKIHFVGIGGIGISALARYYLSQGDEVSGSDVSLSGITRDLQEKGATIFKGHDENNVKDGADLIIYSLAVPEGNPELLRAANLGIERLTYPQAVGRLTKEKKTIAVCGAHGKGTTTAFLSLALIEGGLDPTVVIGTNLEEFGNSNLRLGKSDLFVLEACEYKRAFLNYWPFGVVLTNIDREHLDCYGDLDGVMDAFEEFIKRIPQGGVLVANVDNENVVELLNRVELKEVKVIKTSIEDQDLEVNLPGEHNLSNSWQAFQMALFLGADEDGARKGIASYKGAWRRFEVHDLDSGTIVSDYAHHPSEVSATIQGARERWPNKELVVFFQPHHYQRTYSLLDEFLGCFEEADKVYITNIFSVPGREDEEIKKKVSSEMLVSKIGNASFISREDVTNGLKKEIGEERIVLVMGAGDIYKEVNSLIE